MAPRPQSKGELPFLNAEHPTYTKKKAAWLRDERRLYGGDPVIETELTPFRNEGTDSISLRKRTARYTNFPDLHMTTLVGHLSKNAPEYSFGKLGPVRPLKELQGQLLGLHEQFFFNCDGIGNDGSQYPAWRDGIKRRAGATGLWWAMAEMPTLDDLMDIRRRLAPEGGRISKQRTFTGAEERAGYRVFLRGYSPLEVHNWKFSRSGVLLWAVIWVPLEQDMDVDQSGAMILPEVGRYLLVRKGYEGLGKQFTEGGWWVFNEEHKLQDHEAGWPLSRGEVPLWVMYSIKDEGFTDEPSMGRSLTTELGQIGIDLMNARSEQRYNLRQAAKTVTYLLGIEDKQHTEVIDQLEDQSIVVAVPPVLLADGTVGIPQIWNSSSAAMDASAFQVVLEGGVQDAREIMVKQVTSGPESSGESKKAGFEEATSPLLAAMAETSEEFDNTMLHFVLLMMRQEPEASVTYPRDFPLRDLVDDMDSVIDTVKKAGLNSPTLEVKAVVLKATELGLMDDEDEAALITEELQASAQVREDRASQEAGLFGQIAGRRQFAPDEGDGPAAPDFTAGTPSDPGPPQAAPQALQAAPQAEPDPTLEVLATLATSFDALASQIAAALTRPQPQPEITIAPAPVTINLALPAASTKEVQLTTEDGETMTGTIVTKVEPA